MSPYRRYRRSDPRRHALHYLHSVGRRGTVLTLLGALWVGMGLGVLVTPSSELYWMLAVADVPRGIAWIGTGLLALWFARKPQGVDAPGFAALYLMPAYRVIAYSVGTWEYMTGTAVGLGGSARGIVQVLMYAAVVFLVAVIAGWAEPGKDPAEGDA